MADDAARYLGFAFASADLLFELDRTTLTGKLEVAKKSSPAFVTSELRAGRGGPLQLHPHLHQATPAGSDPDAGHAEHYRRCGDACVRGIAEFYSEDLDFFRFPHLQAAAEATAAAEQQA